MNSMMWPTLSTVCLYKLDLFNDLHIFKLALLYLHSWQMQQRDSQIGYCANLRPPMNLIINFLIPADIKMSNLT